MLDRTKQPIINSLDKIDILTPERRKMSNGIPLNIINVGGQEVTRLDLIFKGGRYQQSKPLQALFTNRMLREGSLKLNSSEIAEKLDYYGAWLELSTSQDYSFLTLYSLNKYFDEILEVIESLVKEPVFPDKELKIVADANKQQFLVNCTKVDVIAQRNFVQAVFGIDHPGGIVPQIEDYDLIRKEDLVDFYNQFYHSANCSVYLSGNVTDKIISVVERSLGNSIWGDTSRLFDHEINPIQTISDKRIFIERPESLQSSIKIGGWMMDRSNPDYLKMRVLMTIYGGYFGSRLMSNIREEKGYTYGISAGIMFYSGTGIFMVATESDSRHVEHIIKEIYHEMNVLKTELVSEEELSMVKNYMIGNMCRNYEGPFSLADAWIFMESNQLRETYFRESLEAVQNVTGEELKLLADKYFHPEKLKEVIVGKKIHNKL